MITLISFPIECKNHCLHVTLNNKFTIRRHILILRSLNSIFVAYFNFAFNVVYFEFYIY